MHANTTHNATNTTPEHVAHAANTTHAVNNTTASLSTLPSTGNPILILMGVMAVLGSAAVLRRKN